MRMCAFLHAAKYTFNELALLIIAANFQTVGAEVGIMSWFSMLQNKKIRRNAEEYASKVEGRTEERILARTSSSVERDSSSLL